MAFGYAGSLVLMLGLSATSPALVDTISTATSQSAVSVTQGSEPLTPHEQEQVGLLMRGSAGAAQVLATSTEEVEDVLLSGADLGEMADAHGVARWTVADAILLAASRTLDEDVAAGLLSREQAQLLLARLRVEADEVLGVTDRPSPQATVPTRVPS